MNNWKIWILKIIEFIYIYEINMCIQTFNAGSSRTFSLVKLYTQMEIKITHNRHTLGCNNQDKWWINIKEPQETQRKQSKGGEK